MALIWNDCLYHHVPQLFFMLGSAVLLHLGVLNIKHMGLLIHMLCFTCTTFILLISGHETFTVWIGSKGHTLCSTLLVGLLVAVLYHVLKLNGLNLHIY